MRFKLFDITVDISFLVVALMSLVLILDKSGKVCACFISALIHECGHLFAMYCYRIKPNGIKLRVFDIVIDAKTDERFLPDMVITLAGPLFNLLFSLVFYFISEVLFIANIVIGVFNLLPVETFDGGHALKLILLKKLSIKTTNFILKALTFLLLLPTFFVGVLVLFYSKYNYSLLLISLYLLAILFLK